MRSYQKSSQHDILNAYVEVYDMNIFEFTKL